MRPYSPALHLRLAVYFTCTIIAPTLGTLWIRVPKFLSYLSVTDFVHVYIDDLLIASSNVDEHYQHLTLLFQRLSDNGIIVNPDKCELGKKEIKFLGHVIKHGVFYLVRIKYVL